MLYNGGAAAKTSLFQNNEFNPIVFVFVFVFIFVFVFLFLFVFVGSIELPKETVENKDVRIVIKLRTFQTFVRLPLKEAWR